MIFLSPMQNQKVVVMTTLWYQNYDNPKSVCGGYLQFDIYSLKASARATTACDRFSASMVAEMEISEVVML